MPPPGIAEGHTLSNSKDMGLHSQDMKHCLSKAAMRSQEISQTLFRNLQTYHTLRSLLGCRGSSDGGSDRTTAVYPAAINTASDEGSMRKFRLSSVHEPISVLKSIDNALDAASSSAVRHNFEPRFTSTLMASMTRRSVLGNPFTDPGDPYSEVDNTTPLHFHRLGASTVDTEGLTNGASLPLHPQHRISNMDVFAEEIFMSAWKRDHPDATPAQEHQRLLEWRKDQIGLRRFQLRQEVGKLHQAIKEEEEMVSTPDDEGYLPMSFSLDATSEGVAFMGLFDADEAEAERQRCIWKQFIEPESLPFANKLPSVADAISSEVAASSLYIVKNYAVDHSVRDWIRSRGWIHRNHIHEAAALCIQRMFRGYTARVNAQRRRVARFLALKVALNAEEATKRQWEVSLKIFQQSSGQVQSTRSLNALLFFENKMRAIIKMNRARNAARAASEAEVVNFAATSIQRVYRGHSARQLVYGMRHPEWLAEIMRRRQTQAAVLIQTLWRGYHTRCDLRRHCQAVWVIQRAYRFHCARALLVHLRRKLTRKSMEELRLFAIQIIVRFLKKSCSKKRTLKCEGVKTTGSTNQEITQGEDKM
ncbi:unnamed protein product [Phytomonas sp. Hart1]|nr:unnamed protein product [Phytomonas sp. Hart1]|eukprot:CCW69673.1 unnamed protein product [Phytomonas sp. isolate Hart1]